MVTWIHVTRVVLKVDKVQRERRKFLCQVTGIGERGLVGFGHVVRGGHAHWLLGRNRRVVSSAKC